MYLANLGLVVTSFDSIFEYLLFVFSFSYMMNSCLVVVCRISMTLVSNVEDFMVRKHVLRDKMQRLVL